MKEKSINSFKPVSQEGFVAIEKRLLDWWYKSGLVKKYLHKNDKAKEKFSFLDGPITANNPMGVHHAWGRTLKDFFQRYKNMRGYRQRFKNGYDCQGLWVEVEVEKELGFKTKKDIESYGIAKFVEKCKQRALKYSKVQTEQSKRLGYFMDWDNSYYTLSDENNYMIWYFLKKCWEDSNLYKGRDTVPWCPRCGTAISQHEILTEEYQEITHKAVYFKLPVKGQKDEYFLVWTTSPWTIPADIALAVNPDFTYAKFENRKTGETLIFLKELADKVFGSERDNWEKVEEFSGKKLAGLYYEAPFDDLPKAKEAKAQNQKTFHIVFLEKELVTAEEGTGIVHISPGSGPEDFKLAKREGLPATEVVDEAGFYVDGYGALSGKNAKADPKLIFKVLREKETGKYLYKVENYTHRYPVCWRCKTELIWRMVDEWYIAMGSENLEQPSLRTKMIAVAKKIRWIPDFGLERELDWLRNMDDWLISKKRYWGLALPIWECSCGHFEVIGSKEELEKRAIAGWAEFVGHTPHRPWVDEVKIKCPKCGKEASRIKDVGNPWLDAGIVPFSTYIDPKTHKVSYLTDKKYWQQWFPADFVTEDFAGQFKNWFYSLIAMATALENENPCKILLGHGLVKDEKGEQMHKSKGNAIEFNEAAEKMGVDVMRWMFLAQNPALNLNFGYHVGDETRRQFHLLLWNVYSFFVTYANIDKWQKEGDPHKSNSVLDKWIMSRLNKLIKTVTNSLDNFDTQIATDAIENFVTDLSTWYVRRSRERIGPTVEDGNNKKFCYATLYEVLASLCQILAPFTPFMAEEMYQNLTTEKSVHLATWPTVGSIDEKLEKDMEQVRKICELAHSARKEAKIKVRQPLNELQVMNAELQISEEILQLIKDELNVKNVTFKKGKGELKVSLDTKLTRELEAEGEARELIRQIQDLRKKANCRLDEKIIIYLPKVPLDTHLKNYIIKETLALEILPGERLEIKRG